MKDNLNIEELFKEKFSSFEGDVSPNAWTNIQQGINAANVTAGAAAAKTGLSLFMKAAIFTGGIVAATVGGIYFFNDNDKEVSETNLVENTINAADNKTQNTVVVPQEDVLVEKSNENGIDEANIQNAGSNEQEALVDEPNINNSQSSSDNSDNAGVDSNTSDVSVSQTGDDDSTPSVAAPVGDDDSSEPKLVIDDKPDVVPQVEVDYPSGNMTFTAGNKFAPSTYSFESNAKNYSTVRWDFGDGTVGDGESVEHTFEKPGSYTVRLTVLGEGEIYEESQTIRIQAKSGIDNISNVITPNGDRINDFFIVNSHDIETFYIVIKDQKGTIVFESNDPDFKWYGVDLGGNALDMGLYIYYIYAKGTDGSEFKIPGEIRIE